MKKLIWIGLFTATTGLSAAPAVYGQQNNTQQSANQPNPIEQTTTQQGQTGGSQQGAYQQKQNNYKPNKGTIAEAAAPTQNAQAPLQDRFSSPDDERLGVEVRGLIIETVGPDQSKGIILIIDKGDVQLNGKIVSEEKKKALIDALTKYKGVKSVNNKLSTSSDQKK